MTKPKDRTKLRRPRKDRSGVKQTENLFMDGWSWRRFNNKIDEEMTKRGLPPEQTPSFIK